MKVRILGIEKLMLLDAERRFIRFSTAAQHFPFVKDRYKQTVLKLAI